MPFRLICLVSDESNDDPFDLVKEGQENVCIYFFLSSINHKILMYIIIILWVVKIILGLMYAKFLKINS